MIKLQLYKEEGCGAPSSLCVCFINSAEFFFKTGITGLCLIKGSHRIMTEDAVLGDEDGGRDCVIFEKQGVMADTEADDNNKIALVFCKHFRLHYGVAHGFMAAAAVHFFLVRHADK